MGRVPRRIDGLEVVLYTPIDGRHRATGACRHVVGGAPRGPVAGLAICRSAGEGAYYLLGCDDSWGCVTDTWHASVDGAMDQAESEYEGVSRTWRRPGDEGPA